MRFAFSFIAFLICGLLFGQDESTKRNSTVLVTYAMPRPEAKVESKYVSNYILTTVQKIVGSKYTSAMTSLYKVTPSYAVTDLRVIETFEKKYYADLAIYLRLRGVGFHKDSMLYKFTGTASASDEKTAVMNAMNTIFSNPKFTGFATHIDSLMDTRYGKNGEATLQALKKISINTMKDGDNVLNELTYFKDYPQWDVQVSAYREVVYDLRSEAFCKTDLPGLKVSVTSTIYSAPEVVKKLLEVSPNASCSGEVLELAKTIGAQLQAKQASSTPDLLPVLIEVHRDRNITRWRERNW